MIGEIGDKKRPLANYAINASIIGKSPEERSRIGSTFLCHDVL